MASFIMTNELGQKMLYLPRTMDRWPWMRAINPHYREVSLESDTWFHSFRAFNPKSQYAYDMCAFGLLASLAFPWADRGQLRTGCDLMNLFFAVDEYTDVEPAHVVREMADIIIDAMTYPEKPRPAGEVILGEIARQFWARGRHTATPSAARHMIEKFTSYLDSCVEQAMDRDCDDYRTVEEYFRNRRDNIGTGPCFVIVELGMDLPDEAYYHPTVVELSIYATDMIILDNDIASYNKEQATGDDRHNILTIVMRQYNLGIEDAMDWVAQYHRNAEIKFFECLQRIPSWGPEIDKNMNEYIRGLSNWPRCNDCWNFESGRYFGKRGLEFQRTRLVPLLPKVTSNKASKGRQENVLVPLFFSEEY